MNNSTLVMKREILKIFMVMAAVLLSCANLLAGSISCDVKDGVLIISGTGNMPDYDGCGPWDDTFSKIVIKEGITSIGVNAFRNCKKLRDITIPNSVTSIGKGAFWYCAKLSTMQVDKDNKTYDSRNDCNAIIETAKNTLIFGCENTKIPNSVTSIGDYAFGGCPGLTSITIPNSVTSIGDFAFGGCSGLTSITIPNSVTSIGDYAFFACSGLTSITIPNSVTSIGDNAFRDCI